MTNSNNEIIQIWIKEIIFQIDVAKRVLKNKELLHICGGIDKITNGEFNPHFCHEIAETALNHLILTKYTNNPSENPVEFVRQTLKPLVSRLPTQTWRSREQISLQQFSTPPAIGFLLGHILNMQQGEIVLEPSAGTGSLAIWAKVRGAEVLTNELAARRRELLRQLGFKPTAYHAEFIHDFLAPCISPDCVVMNPPFSSSGGRTKNNSSKFGFRHVESALERLKKGGKFGVILGETAGVDTKTGNDFWRKHSDRIEVSAVIKINGREYARYGTTVDINLIIGKKFLVPQRTDWNEMLNKIICFSANTVEEAFTKAETFSLRLNQ